MKHRRLLLCVGILTTFALPAQAQVPPEKAVSTFQVADGLEMSLWASEPLFVNPTCMDIDHRGRVWVCESVNYRDTLHHRPLKRPAGDRIVILEDTKGTGRADKATTFYQSKELLAPLGIAVAKDPVGPGYKVYVCQSPDILLFEDKDGDGKADGPPRKLLSGFRGIDHDHGVHGILIGPDNRLYFSVGDPGVDGLVDRHGKRWTTNNTDCQAGTIWRCDLDGKNLELLAHNFRNEYEPCVDSFGTIFVSDNDDDGNQQTRICHVMPGGNYGYWPRGPGQSHWHEEQPGVVPKILRTYFGSPTGMCVYEGTLLPKKYWGQLLHTDAGPRHVRCYHLKPQGASYAVEREDMVTSTDNWFRPSDICVAPDGSVYVADWYDPGVGGHGMGDITRGRIFRIAPRGNRPIVPQVDLESNAGLLRALAAPALSVRYMAMEKVRQLPTKRAQEVLETAVDQRENIWLRARALWQIAALRIPSDDYLTALTDEDPRIRTLLLRALKEYSTAHGWKAALWHAPKDRSPEVRREALVQLRDLDPDEARTLFYELARQYDGKDRFYLEAVGIAVGQDSRRREILLADFEKHFPGWDEKTANLIWELRPPKALARLEKHLIDATASAHQRTQIVDIIASSDDTSGGKILLRALDAGLPVEAQNRILEHLQHFLPGKWRDLRQSKELASTIDRFLDRPESTPHGLALIGAAGRTDYLEKVSNLAKDAKQPPAVRTAAIQTLAVMPSAESVAALDSLLKTGSLALRTEVVQALGRQLQSERRRGERSPALRPLQELVRGTHQDLTLRQAAAGALASSRAGSMWLLAAETKKALPQVLKPEVARLLRNSPYQDLRNRALIAFPPPTRLDPKQLPSIAALARLEGDSRRGKQLLAVSINNDHQCLKCHTIHGKGGSVGPDLSAIGSKASRENLLESILLPSKAIADQYLTWIIVTNQGLSLSGLIVEETPVQITLRDANGKDTKIKKSDIDTRSKSPISLMPSDLLAYMTETDLVDMVEYLLTLKTTAK